MKVNFPIISKISEIKRKKVATQPKKSPLKSDTFEHTSVKTVKCADRTITGHIVKNVEFSDRNGSKVPGYILQEDEHDNKFWACTENEAQCHMRIENSINSILLAELFGRNNQGEVKGAGTELLKYAADKSREKGHKGRVILTIGGSFPFYYKNNVRMTGDKKTRVRRNAIVDYITRTNASPSRIKYSLWNKNWGAPVAELTEENAELMSAGKRICDETKSGILYSTVTEINTHNNPKKTEVDMHFYEDGENFIIQMIDKNTDDYAVKGYLEGKIQNGQLIPRKFDEETSRYKNSGVKNELEKAFKAAKKIYNKKNTEQ